MNRERTRQLLDFLQKSPSPYHAVANMAKELEDHGYRCLYEEEGWELLPGGRYYVTRGGSALIAFALPDQPKPESFQIMASHSDSPTFKLKEAPELLVDDRFVKLNVEKYGGMLMAPWFDRPLSIAGRLLVRQGEEIQGKLADAGRDLVMIPNLAIHMNRNANDGQSYNPQVDLLPLFGGREAKGKLMTIMAESAGVSPEDVVASDLFLYNRMPGTIWGANEEFVSCGRLDDLQCAFASLKGLLAAEANPRRAMVHCVFDNEEVGSLTRQGAASTFLKDVLTRIAEDLSMSREEYLRALAGSFMVSADNAHSVHPNHGEKADQVNRPYLNEGIVVKFSANQRYTTDGASAAVFRELCRQAEVPCQTFFNRSDMVGGSTLGNLSNGQVALHTVDIGLPQLAMHSPYETAGVEDTASLVKAAAAFYGADIEIRRDGCYRVSLGKGSGRP